MKTRLVSVLGACALVGWASAQTAPPSTGAPPRVARPPAERAPVPGASAATAGKPIAELILSWNADRNSIEDFYSVTWSEERLDRLDEFLKRSTEELAKRPASTNVSDIVDEILVRNLTRAELSENALARRRLAEINVLLPFRQEIVNLERARWAGEPINAEAAASTLAKFPTMIKAIRARVESGRTQPLDPANADGPLPLSPVIAQRAARAVSSLRSSLSTWHGNHAGFVPEFSWWTKAPYDAAVKSLDEYAQYLKADIAGLKGEPEDPLVGDPIGRDALLESLRDEMIAYSPEELLAIGEREFAWVEAQMRAQSQQMGLGDDWRAALERVKQDHVPPGEQAALMRAQATEAIEFVTSRNLITVPPIARDLWRTQMLSLHEQRSLPFAAYNDQHIMVGYPTDEVKHDDKLMSMRGNNRHFSRIVAPHELIPGHHLQIFIAARERPYRRLFSTPFFVEGWALYWEMKLWDLGWGRTPEERMGMLFWRGHRCARIIVSLKFHLGQMQPQEMIDFLVDRLGHERANATSEVRRFIGGDYSPLYQCGYMIGGLQMRALWEEAVTKGGMSELEFNDRVLRGNAIPIELVRSEILGAPLSRDAEAVWKFAGDPVMNPAAK